MSQNFYDVFGLDCYTRKNDNYSGEIKNSSSRISNLPPIPKKPKEPKETVIASKSSRTTKEKYLSDRCLKFSSAPQEQQRVDFGSNNKDYEERSKQNRERNESDRLRLSKQECRNRNESNGKSVEKSIREHHERSRSHNYEKSHSRDEYASRKQENSQQQRYSSDKHQKELAKCSTSRQIEKSGSTVELSKNTNKGQLIESLFGDCPKENGKSRRREEMDGKHRAGESSKVSRSSAVLELEQECRSSKTVATENPYFNTPEASEYGHLPEKKYKISKIASEEAHPNPPLFSAKESSSPSRRKNEVISEKESTKYEKKHKKKYKKEYEKKEYYAKRSNYEEKGEDKIKNKKEKRKREENDRLSEEDRDSESSTVVRGKKVTSEDLTICKKYTRHRANYKYKSSNSNSCSSREQKRHRSCSKNRHRKYRRESESANDFSESASEGSSSEVSEQENVVVNCKKDEYLAMLVDLQRKIMTSHNGEKLNKLIELIVDSSEYDVCEKFFNFDLCALDLFTVKKIQKVFKHC